MPDAVDPAGLAIELVDGLVTEGVVAADAVSAPGSLAPWSTYRVGGPAAVAVIVPDADALAALAARTAASAAAGRPVDVLVVGNGSNLLVADAGFPGIAVRLGDGFADVTIEGTEVRAGAAALLPRVARATAKAGLTGFEWAVGVPGSIGGAVRMNAGGHGSDMAASLVGVRVVDLATGHDGPVPAAALHLAYRRSAVAAHHVVVEATLTLQADAGGTASETVSEIVAWRRAHQPGGQNAGSVFTNPTMPDGSHDSAGRLIDTAGGKGLRIGTAEVSTKHANFIQADPDGRADDVHAVMVAVHRLVRERHGVSLHPETRLVGFPAGPWDEAAA